MKKWIIVLICVVALFVIAGAIYYFVGGDSSSSSQGVTLKNPVSGLTDSQAVQEFDESYVLYLLYLIDADELKSTPLSRETPKIEIRVGEEIFHAEILDGKIEIKKALMAEKDIIIFTKKEEIVKMLRDKNYFVQSFESGNSRIEVLNGKVSLAAKGYLNLYEKISGKDD